FSSQQANRLRVFTGNPGTMNGTTLYNTITGANHHSYDNIPTGVNTLPINATGVSIVQANITGAINVGYYKTAYNGSYYVHGSDGVGNGSTDVNKRPILRVTYTIPSGGGGVPTQVGSTASANGTIPAAPSCTDWSGTWCAGSGTHSVLSLT